MAPLPPRAFCSSRRCAAAIARLSTCLALLASACASPPPPPAPPPAPSDTYLVQPGDTLSEIAVWLGVPLENLVELNGIADPRRLRVGRELLIPGRGTIEHRVAQGETLTVIARRYGVSVEDVAAANSLEDPDRLPEDSTLAIPRPTRASPVRLAALPKPPQSRPSVGSPAPKPVDVPPDPILEAAEDLLAEAEEAWSAADFQKTLAAAEEAEGALGDAAGSPAVRAAQARAAFLRGLAHTGLEEPEQARRAFAEARERDPEWQPDPSWLSPKVKALSAFVDSRP